MNWEAFGIISFLALVLGFFLSVIGIAWAKRWLNNHPKSQGAGAITRVGWVMNGCLVIAIFAGLTSKYWAPESAFAEWIDSGYGMAIYYMVLMVVSVVVERILISLGYRTIATKNDSAV